MNAYVLSSIQADLVDARPASRTESLPAYEDVVRHHTVFHSDEKAATPAKTSKISTLKSMLTGDVQKHNPRYNLERSLEPILYDRKPEGETKRSSTSTTSSQSTLKSIVNGDVFKHHPMRALERQLDEQMRSTR